MTGEAKHSAKKMKRRKDWEQGYQKGNDEVSLASVSLPFRLLFLRLPACTFMLAWKEWADSKKEGLIIKE